MPEGDRKKGCRNDGKRSQKGAKMEPEIRPKCPQGAKGEPKSRPKGQKGRKKGMPKTKPKKVALEDRLGAILGPINRKIEIKTIQDGSGSTGVNFFGRFWG